MKTLKNIGYCNSFDAHVEVAVTPSGHGVVVIQSDSEYIFISADVDCIKEAVRKYDKSSN